LNVTKISRTIDMPIKHMDEYRDPKIARRLLAEIEKTSKRDIRLMEVCGTHTMSIFRSGIRSALPESISLLSGPGCPVCVTAQNEIDAFILLSRVDDVVVATFGDLMRVPGSESSLQKERAKGRDVRVVYSTFDALDMAKQNPEKKIVFLGVGFETTAPTIAAAIISARDKGLHNFFVFSAHKLIPPALSALLATEGSSIDGLILPGHVSVIIGTGAYLRLVEDYHVPCAVAGFEPVDILQAVHVLVEQLEKKSAHLENCYPRAVTFDGNKKAQQVMETVFKKVDALRGVGPYPYGPASGSDEPPARREAGQPLPDLLMVDGGKGQLSMAIAVLKALRLYGSFDLIGIAKKDPERGETEDKIYKPGRKNPVNLKKDTDVLLFLQRIRDEAHRAVITYHRKRRLMTCRRSVLEEIPGIGKRRRMRLLKHFGSLKRIKAASIEELAAVPGMTRQAAQAVFDALK